MNVRICNDFMFGKCERKVCKFDHIENVCFYFWKNGSCKFNEKCTKSHEFKKVYKETREKEREKDVQQKNKPKRNKDKYNKKKIKNTECFVPMDKSLVDLRIICDTNNTSLTSKDLILEPNIFSDYPKYEIYNKLLYEINNCGIPEEELFKMWHGNNKINGTHLIVDDHLDWKEKCPTFNLVLERIVSHFKMDIKATRFNYYKDTSHWKPFHHDSAHVNPEKAKNQNFTVAVSFGKTRDAALEHAKTKTVISLPQPDGYVYAFLNDTNSIWRHGILQEPEIKNDGRISIIAWGWTNIKGTM